MEAGKRSQTTARKWGPLLGSAALLLSPPDPSHGDSAAQIAYGKHLARECTSCHRLDGVDNGIPAIIGWDADTFRSTMQFYKEGLRKNQAMESVANSLEGEQIEALAAYFAAVPKPKRETRAKKGR